MGSILCFSSYFQVLTAHKVAMAIIAAWHKKLILTSNQERRWRRRKIKREQALTIPARAEETRKEIQLVQLTFSGTSIINASNTAVHRLHFYMDCGIWGSVWGISQPLCLIKKMRLTVELPSGVKGGKEIPSSAHASDADQELNLKILSTVSWTIAQPGWTCTFYFGGWTMQATSARQCM